MRSSHTYDVHVLGERFAVRDRSVRRIPLLLQLASPPRPLLPLDANLVDGIIAHLVNGRHCRRCLRGPGS